MSSKAASVKPTDVEKVVRKIVDRFRPERIILFGSRAYGTPHPDSDIDLLVVTPSLPTRGRLRRVDHSLGGKLPVQAFFMTPEEFEETKDVVGGLAYPAHHWGKVLYEAHT